MTQQQSKFAPLMATQTEMLSAINKVEGYKKYCLSQISECDKALSDLDHLIELYRLDAVKLTRVIGKRREVLQQRRFFKDEVARADIVSQEMPRTQDFHGQINQISEKLKEYEAHCESREFTPRVLFDLFSDDEEIVAKLKQTRKDITMLGSKVSKKALRMEEKFRKISV